MHISNHSLSACPQLAQLKTCTDVKLLDPSKASCTASSVFSLSPASKLALEDFPLHHSWLRSSPRAPHPPLGTSLPPEPCDEFQITTDIHFSTMGIFLFGERRRYEGKAVQVSSYQTGKCARPKRHARKRLRGSASPSSTSTRRKALELAKISGQRQVSGIVKYG